MLGASLDLMRHLSVAEVVRLMDSATALISVVSIVISVLAVWLSYYTFRRTLKEGVRPALIFSRRSETLWQIQNVGNGPAISLIVVDMDRNGEWRTVANCYPLSSGAGTTLQWVEYGYQFAAIYTDINGGFFTTHYMNGQNRLVAKNKFPALKANRDEWFLVIASNEDIESALTEADLAGKSAFDLDIMRNEIYAHHGYKFRRRDLADYFSKQTWYNPTTNNQFSVYCKFSATEKYNVEFIRDYQIRNGLTTNQSRPADKK